MDLRNRVTVITGGARIGQVVAQEIAAAGSDIALVYRQSRVSAEQTAEAVEATGRRVLLVQADFEQPAEIGSIIPAVEKEFGRLDVLINMASHYARTPIKTLTAVDLQINMATDMNSAYQLSLAAAPLMRKNHGGRIINFSDWTAVSNRPRYKDYLPYYIAKTAVQALTEGLALELAPDILVNAVAPGPILPPKNLPHDAVQAVVDVTPLHRWGGAEEIAKTVLFLIATDFITGECIRVDGGRHLV